MTLQDYLNRPDAKKRNELCEGLGISAGRLSQLRDETEWPPELALKLEAVTDGIISASAISSVVAKARATA